MNNFNRFTIKAQEALQGAQEIASAENHGEFKGIHLLISLLNDGDTLIHPIFTKANINLDDLDEDLDTAMKRHPKNFGAPKNPLKFWTLPLALLEW